MAEEGSKTILYTAQGFTESMKKHTEDNMKLTKNTDSWKVMAIH